MGIHATGGMGMLLETKTEILWRGMSITKGSLLRDWEKWKSNMVIPDAHHTLYSNYIIIRWLLLTFAPYNIISDKKWGPLKFQAYLTRFPQQPHGHCRPASFGLRLVPKQGRVKRIQLRSSISGFSYEEIIEPEDFLSANLGNGGLRLEIYFHPICKKLKAIPKPV